MRCVLRGTCARNYIGTFEVLPGPPSPITSAPMVSFVPLANKIAMSTISGSCLCGSVCFEVTLPPIRFQYCHCASCRKATSSSHAANLFFALDRFRWVTGESLVERFVDQAVNLGYMRWFCRKCGSAVPRLNRTNQYYVVPAGLLDADPIVKPERSVYWDDRAPWLINIDAIPKVSEELDSIMREQARNDFPARYPP